jgi:hypothetical protein
VSAGKSGSQHIAKRRQRPQLSFAQQGTVKLGRRGELNSKQAMIIFDKVKYPKHIQTMKMPINQNTSKPRMASTNGHAP